MARYSLIIAYSCVILLLGGCNESQPEQPSLDDIKIGDLAPIRTDSRNNRILKNIHFDCYSFELPAKNIEQLTEIAEELSDVGMIEQKPNREGRTMLMILTPVKN